MPRPLALFMLALATAAIAQAEDEDAAHHADRMRTGQLNRQALQASQPHLTYDARGQRAYEAARKRYEQEMAAWRERVAACQAGDWSACR